jgi:gluconokinase
MKIPGLRSPAVRTGGMVYFARMIDKVRLHAAGKLPEDYQVNLGKGFDGRACNFLRLNYDAFKARVLQGGTDEELLQWAFTQGRKPTEEEIEIWSEFMRKRGWRDEGSEILAKRKAESGFTGRDDIATMFEYIDADEAQ